MIEPLVRPGKKLLVLVSADHIFQTKIKRIELATWRNGRNVMTTFLPPASVYIFSLAQKLPKLQFFNYFKV